MGLQYDCFFFTIHIILLVVICWFGKKYCFFLEKKIFLKYECLNTDLTRHLCIVYLHFHVRKHVVWHSWGNIELPCPPERNLKIIFLCFEILSCEFSMDRPGGDGVDGLVFFLILALLMEYIFLTTLNMMKYADS